MAKFIIDNKLYDTEKAEEVITYIENGVSSIIPWKKVERTLYLSPKGNWFAVTKRSRFQTPYISVKSSREVSSILERLNVVELYDKYFDLEEA